jgi:ABC-2 type transport system ATP-binding protein
VWPAALYVKVDDAGEWLPEVLNLLEDADGPGIAVESAEEKSVSYDDIFIALMQQDEAASERKA